MTTNSRTWRDFNTKIVGSQTQKVADKFFRALRNSCVEEANNDVPWYNDFLACVEDIEYYGADVRVAEAAHAERIYPGCADRFAEAFGRFLSTARVDDAPRNCVTLYESFLHRYLVAVAATGDMRTLHHKQDEISYFCLLALDAKEFHDHILREVFVSMMADLCVSAPALKEESSGITREVSDASGSASDETTVSVASSSVAAGGTPSHRGERERRRAPHVPQVLLDGSVSTGSARLASVGSHRARAESESASVSARVAPPGSGGGGAGAGDDDDTALSVGGAYTEDPGVSSKDLMAPPRTPFAAAQSPSHNVAPRAPPRQSSERSRDKEPSDTASNASHASNASRASVTSRASVASRRSGTSKASQASVTSRTSLTQRATRASENVVAPHLLPPRRVKTTPATEDINVDSVDSVDVPDAPLFVQDTAGEEEESTLTPPVPVGHPVFIADLTHVTGVNPARGECVS